jgi:hypothetical protein
MGPLNAVRAVAIELGQGPRIANTQQPAVLGLVRSSRCWVRAGTAPLDASSGEADDRAEPTDVEAPMTRYKYGPWDDRYYPVIGALVARGLLRYTRGRRGSVALAPTALGKRQAEQIAVEPLWQPVWDRCTAVAEASGGMTGNALKTLAYNRLAELMDRRIGR